MPACVCKIAVLVFLFMLWVLCSFRDGGAYTSLLETFFPLLFGLKHALCSFAQFPIPINIISIIIYSFVARVVGAPQMISQPVSSIFPCSPLPSGTWRTPGFCLPCLLPPFTVPCKVFLARPDEQETWPYHCSLHLYHQVFMWSNYLLDLGMDFLVGNMVFVWDV